MISKNIKVTSINSFPFVFFERAAIPASKAPILFIIPITPPKISTKITISTESATPATGDFIISTIP